MLGITTHTYNTDDMTSDWLAAPATISGIQ